ncbi:MAG TPA: oligosaccharide flippase family protein [Thermoanaerobaculia bacterium]|nr:oligosaccharide flippase family protein [Thermoanaerobaculia bacterium]
MPSIEATAPVAAVRAERPRSGVSGKALRRGGAFFAASQFLGMGLGFLGSTVMVRVAAPQDVASYLLILQAIMALGLILQLGLGPAALRFVPVSRGERGTRATSLLRRRLFRIQLTLWCVIVPPLALAWPWIARRLDAPELAKATPFLIAAGLLASLGHLADNYLRAFRLYASSALFSHLTARVLLLGGFAALWLSAAKDVPWEMLLTVFLGAQLAQALGYVLTLPRTTPGETSEPRTALDPPDIRTILGVTTAMGLRSAASVLFVSADLWVLSWARPHEEVAVYGIVSRVLQVMAALPGIANFLIPQELAMLYADGRRDEMESLARTASTAMALLSGGCFLGILVLGRPLLHLAFGDTYMAGWSILLVLAVGTFWDTASGSAGYALQMSGHHTRLLLLTAAAAVMNVGLSLALARTWGGHGVALATTITLIVLNLAMVRSARRLVGIRTFVYFQPARWLEVLRMARTKGGAT